MNPSSNGQMEQLSELTSDRYSYIKLLDNSLGDVNTLLILNSGSPSSFEKRVTRESFNEKVNSTRWQVKVTLHKMGVFSPTGEYLTGKQRGKVVGLLKNVENFFKVPLMTDNLKY